MFQSKLLSKDVSINQMISLAWKYRDMPTEEYLKLYLYWFSEYNSEINRWEDDGGTII